MDQYTNPNTRLPQFDVFLLEDRAWPRRYRMKHAAAMESLAVTTHEQVFWRGVVKANERFKDEHRRPVTTRGWDDRTGHWKPVVQIDRFWKEQL